MREILFRGKRKDNGKWVEGHYGEYCNGKENVACISIPKETISGSLCYEVILKTVGQYTGLTDKDGTKIFEGDIVHWKKVTYFVRWDSKKAEFVFANDMEADYFVVGFNEHTTMKFCKVIGNIFDNPELTKIT